MAILETLLSGGLGAAVGAVAGVTEKLVLTKMESESKAKEYLHIEALHRLDSAHKERLAQNGLIETEMETEATMRVASYAHDTDVGETSLWVNNIRALVRPASVFIGFLLAFYKPPEFLPILMVMVAWYFASRARTVNPG